MILSAGTFIQELLLEETDWDSAIEIRDDNDSDKRYGVTMVFNDCPQEYCLWTSIIYIEPIKGLRDYIETPEGNKDATEQYLDTFPPTSVDIFFDPTENLTLRDFLIKLIDHHIPLDTKIKLESGSLGVLRYNDKTWTMTLENI